MGKDTGMGGLVLKGLGFGSAKRFRLFGGTCAWLGRNRLRAVALLSFHTALLPCTSHRLAATVGSRRLGKSTARLVGGLPNPHPRWVGS
jgi:hypothetical protein